MENTNLLYPIFLKLDQINVTIIGGGSVAEEKVLFILKSSPNANLKLHAKSFSPKIKQLHLEGKIKIFYNIYQKHLLKDATIVIGATNDNDINTSIYYDAKSLGKLVNIVDTPELCDFYLGSIVNKGNLKIALSSNGQSPTYIKRLKEVLEETIDEQENNLLIDNLNQLRNHLKNDFSEKVRALNALTNILSSKVDYANN